MKRLPFHVYNRHGTLLAAFAWEPDADRWARERAEATFQTPVEVFSVRDMTKTVKLPNGRLIGELVCEYDSRPVSAAPFGVAGVGQPMSARAGDFWGKK